jgi:two-component system heavy metal sensor histidine kinase CusS
MKFKSIPIGVRLTALYFIVMAVGMSALGWIAIASMKYSIRRTVDEELEDRIKGVSELIGRSLRSVPPASLAIELRDHSELGAEEAILQVADEDGHFVFQSHWARNHQLPTFKLPPSNKRFSNFRDHGEPFRVLSAAITVEGRHFGVQVAEPMDDFYEALARFRNLLLALIPLLLIIASSAGYWMSRKALAPVDEITRAAQEINAHNLSARLAVPKSRDELQRLAETLNAMLERIESSMRRISQFTADASHELRTPVALMRTRAELALRRPRTEAEYHETIDQLLQELVRTSDLIEKLMLLARSDSNTELLHFAKIDLGATLLDVLRQTSALAEAKQLTLLSELTSDPVVIEGDAQFLRQLFVILIDNAVKYTPAPGTVTVALTATESTAIISVSDTGIGIEPADLANIFDRFYRADKARTRESGGAGLGLAIGRWIAESHGGSIVAESVSGKGSTFRVSLPRAL